MIRGGKIFTRMLLVQRVLNLMQFIKNKFTFSRVIDTRYLACKSKKSLVNKELSTANSHIMANKRIYFSCHNVDF